MNQSKFNFNKTGNNFYKTMSDFSTNFSVRNIKTASTIISKPAQQNLDNNTINLFTHQNVNKNNLTTYNNFTTKTNYLNLTSKNTNTSIYSPKNKNNICTTNYQNLNSTQKSNNIADGDINTLLNYYDQNTEDSQNNSEKIDILRKFRIDNNLNPYEEEKIREFMKNNTNKIINSSNYYNFLIKKFSKILKISNTNDSCFKDPIYSLEKLNLNKQIYNNVVTFRKNKQIETYLDQYNLAIEKNIKNKNTRKIKEIILKSGNNLNEENMKSNDTDLNYENQDDLKSPIVKKLSRECILSNDLELHISYSSDLKSKPFARSQFTLVLDGAYLYMFGGISGDLLYQTWICDIKSIKFNL